MSENFRCDERESTIVINTEAPASQHVFSIYLYSNGRRDLHTPRAKKIFSTQKEEPYMNMMSHVLLKKEFQQPSCRSAPHRRHICLCMYECVYTTSEKPPKSIKHAPKKKTKKKTVAEIRLGNRHAQQIQQTKTNESSWRRLKCSARTCDLSTCSFAKRAGAATIERVAAAVAHVCAGAVHLAHGARTSLASGGR